LKSSGALLDALGAVIPALLRRRDKETGRLATAPRRIECLASIEVLRYLRAMSTNQQQIAADYGRKYTQLFKF
jgi:hypothetical protein